ncbi:MAG: hypothetical protein MUE93_03905, partial [Ignavibacteriaceae bacterium]|nr:hypothetical protein [Ignavibacteriaceae bacterium]
VTKLLPPLSTVYQFELKSDIENNLSEAEIFRKESEEVIKPSFNDNIIFADSVKVSGDITYFQKNESKEVKIEKLIFKDGKPNIKEKFFLLGTDEFGRDLFVRLIYGTRFICPANLWYSYFYNRRIRCDCAVFYYRDIFRIYRWLSGRFTGYCA